MNKYYDKTPTEGSNNPVTSGGVFDAIKNEDEKVTQIGLKLGDLANLQTTEKSNLVGAINEVKAATEGLSSDAVDITYVDNQGLGSTNVQGALDIVGNASFFESDDLWEVTRENGYIAANGSWSTDSAFSSCLLKMIPNSKYRVIMQTTGDAGNYLRVFTFADDVFTQVTFHRGSGTTYTYTCPDDGQEYYIQVNRKKAVEGNPQIYRTTAAGEQCLFFESYKKVVDAELFTNGENIATQFEGGYIDENGNFVSSSTYFRCLITLTPNYVYKILVRASTHMRVFRLVGNNYEQVYHFYQASDAEIEYTCPDDGNVYVLQVIKHPGQNKTPEVYCYNSYLAGKVKVLEDTVITKKEAKSIKILCVGNSYTRDEISYVPALLENIAGMDVTIGILYYPNCSLQQHYEFISTGNNYNAYDEYLSVNGKWVTTTGHNADYALSKYRWDIITFQQWSNHSRYYNTYQPYLNDIINIILSKINYSVKLGWILTPAYPNGYNRLGEDTSDSMFEKICVAVQQMMNNTVIDFYIPVGTAIQNATRTELVNLGDFGGMFYEGLHLQEGVPCLIAAYTIAQYILNITGNGNKGIYGNQIRPTDEWIAAQNIPQQNGTSVGVTDANCIIAQKCASVAIKKPLEISDMTELGVI